ncbi:unnamed protein product, partial [Amoebophrya sp. A120]
GKQGGASKKGKSGATKSAASASKSTTAASTTSLREQVKQFYTALSAWDNRMRNAILTLSAFEHPMEEGISGGRGLERPESLPSFYAREASAKMGDHEAPSRSFHSFGAQFRAIANFYRFEQPRLLEETAKKLTEEVLLPLETLVQHWAEEVEAAAQQLGGDAAAAGEQKASIRALDTEPLEVEAAASVPEVTVVTPPGAVPVAVTIDKSALQATSALTVTNVEPIVGATTKGRSKQAAAAKKDALPTGEKPPSQELPASAQHPVNPPTAVQVKRWAGGPGSSPPPGAAVKKDYHEIPNPVASGIAQTTAAATTYYAPAPPEAAAAIDQVVHGTSAEVVRLSATPAPP